jgi:hypothetical protein
MSELKKVIKEVLCEEDDELYKQLNKPTLKQLHNKRFVATIDLYVIGESKEEAMIEVNEILSHLDKTYDNKASLVDLKEQPFGTISQ